MPTPVQLPGFKLIEAEVDTAYSEPIVQLIAELETETEIVSECGFELGINQQSFRKYPATFNGDKFTVSNISLEYDSQYLFRGYIGNGKNTLFSDIDTLVIPSHYVEPSTPDQTPEEPDSGFISDSGSVPDSDSIREFEISHVERYLHFYHSGILSSSENCPWLRNTFYDLKSVYFTLSFEENTSLYSRETTLIITGEYENYPIRVIQHSCLDTIDFQCPEVKKACVALCDEDGDGEVSYYEASRVPNLRKEDFAGHEISTFNELPHFVSAVRDFNNEVSDGLFEESSLKEVFLQGFYSYHRLPKRIFKDCRSLEKVDLGSMLVEEEAFMNCVSLSDIKASVYGPRAFMGCSGLKSMVQHRAGVPEMAFKGCTSLSTFVFEIVNDSSVEPIPIEEEAFYGCISLKEITVPREIPSILDRAFYGCSSLESITFESIQPPILGEDVFEGTSPNLKIYVLEPLVSHYQRAWSELSDKIVGL